MAQDQNRASARGAFAVYAASIGFFSLLVQVVAMRELLTSFFGNELVIGLVLADWLLLVALGAWLAGSLGLGRHSWHLAAGHVLLAGAMPFCIYVARAVGAHGWLPGLTVGPVQAALGAAQALLLPCLLLGAAFSMAVRFAETALGGGRDAAARTYALESLGAVAAGALFHFFLADHLVSAAIAVAMSVCALGVAALIAPPVSAGMRLRVLMAVGTAVVVAVPPAPMKAAQWLRRTSLQARWRGFDLVDSLNTRYGNIAVCRQGSQLAFFYDGLLAFTTEDLVASEELAHLALLAADLENGSGNVLVIGGAFGGLLREIAKHPVRRVDYMELDAQAVEFIEKHAGADEMRLLGPRLHLIHADPRAALAYGSARSYSAVILNLPPPHNAVVARLYSLEFLARHLLYCLDGPSDQPPGVVVVRLPAAQTNLSRERAMLHKSIYLALKRAFFDCDPLVAVGEAGVYLIARVGGWLESPAKVAELLQRRFDRRHIVTSFVTPPYIAYMLSPFRTEMYLHSLARVDVPPTSDRLPICYRHYLSLWTRQYSQRLSALLERAPRLVAALGWLLAGVVFALWVLAALGWLRPTLAAYTAIAACGFAEIAASFAIMLEFQIQAGYLFHQLGLLTGLFMGGLAVGSWLAAEGLRVRRGRTARAVRRLSAPTIAWVAAAAVAASFAAAALPGSGVGWPFALLVCILGAAPVAALAVALSAWRHLRSRRPNLARFAAKAFAAGAGFVVALLLLAAVGGRAGSILVAAAGLLLGMPTAVAVWLAALALRGRQAVVSELTQARPLLALSFGLLVAAVGLVAVLTAAGGLLRTASVSVVCGFASLYAGIAGGAIYALTVAMAGGETSPTASRIYAIDLVASSAGALAVAVFLVPVIGLPGTCGVIIAICAAGASAASAQRRRRG